MIKCKLDNLKLSGNRIHFVGLYNCFLKGFNLIYSINGTISPAEMGITPVHEHILWVWVKDVREKTVIFLMEWIFRC